MTAGPGRKKPPCVKDGKPCTKRQMLCQAHCEEYKEFEEDRRLVREARINRLRQIEDLRVTRARAAARHDKHERDKRR